MNCRKFLSVALVAAFAALSITGTLAQNNPIRIGLLAPLTGSAASSGRELVDGWDLYWNQVGRTVANRQVEVTIEDDGSVPDIALQKARRLVQRKSHSTPPYPESACCVEV